MKLRSLFAGGLIALGLCPVSATAAVPLRDSRWSGYVAQAKPGQSVEAVATSFIVPKIDCQHTPTTGTNATAIWIGLDGVGIAGARQGQTVEQAGITLSCMAGVQRYRAWTEMFPKSPVFLSNQIRAFDEIDVDASVHKGVYKFTVQDFHPVDRHWTNMTHWTQTRYATCLHCLNESADFIVERVFPFQYMARYYGSVTMKEAIWLNGSNQQLKFGDTSQYFTHKFSAYRGNTLLATPQPWKEQGGNGLYWDEFSERITTP